MIPANVDQELADLQAQIALVGPLMSAARADVLALQLNAKQLVVDLDAAVTTTAGQLDTWTEPPNPALIANGMQGVLANAVDHNAVVLMRGLVGRVTSNLMQVPLR